MGLEYHQITNSINQDFNSILESIEMKSFEAGLSYKSQKTVQVDMQLMNMLLNRLKTYKNGWITCNALKTQELYNKTKEIESIVSEFKKLNESLNQIIILMKSNNLISDEKLHELREVEIQLRKLSL